MVTEFADRLSERLLQDFTLAEIMEMNDLSEEDVLVLLIDGGLIGEPERIVAEIEEISKRD